MARSLVLISGYYGFDNLGDEAILEQLITEIKAANISPSDIVVLSNNPLATRTQFAVQTVNRWKLKEIIALLPRTKLFISGGGGLFQDTDSLKSIVYYGSLITIARIFASKILIYAQGLGPLKKALSQNLTKQFLQLAEIISVRDDNSYKQLEQWGLKAKSIKTADPVWALQPSAIPEVVSDLLARYRSSSSSSSSSRSGPTLIGISLRSGAGFTQGHLKKLVETLEATLDTSAILVMLPLQDEQDRPILQSFVDLWQSKDRTIWLPPDTSLLPSQWLSLIASLDMVIGMRLHSLIMSLASGKPVIGISYDPKVEIVLNQFKQPNLTFTRNEDNQDCDTWPKIIKDTLNNYNELAANARDQAKDCRQLACQNSTLIAKILAF